jgi:hypothetical protein
LAVATARTVNSLPLELPQVFPQHPDDFAMLRFTHYIFFSFFLSSNILFTNYTVFLGSVYITCSHFCVQLRACLERVGPVSLSWVFGVRIVLLFLFGRHFLLPAFEASEYMRAFRNTWSLARLVAGMQYDEPIEHQPL